MNWFSGKFEEPTRLTGDWFDRRETSFWHDDDPPAVRFAVEKMTTTLMERDDASTTLVYRGTSSIGGSPRTVRLSLEAVIDRRSLYALAVERSMPRRWIDETRFIADCERSFAYWCSKLEIARSAADRRAASPEALRAVVDRTRVVEDAAAAVVEDPAPIAALQREILDALRAGQGFFTANKEGGSHLDFDGAAFVRADYGDEPNLFETYDEAGMLDALRRFYDWASGSKDYPHRPPERAVWQYIKGELGPR